jgi:hypothetical protein
VKEHGQLDKEQLTVARIKIGCPCDQLKRKKDRSIYMRAIQRGASAGRRQKKEGGDPFPERTTVPWLNPKVENVISVV